MTAPRISYVLGVHNSAAFLEATVDSLVDRLRDLPGSEVILVENGSSDSSAEVCARLASDAPVRVVAATSEKGLGYAFRRGIEVATGDLLVLTGADLPFGFGDLDACLGLDPLPAVVLGSKAHPQSQIDVTPTRRILSKGFSLARWIILGIKAGDTQGSNLINGDLARRILPHLRCGDYLIQTEIVAWAVRFGVKPVEVPVVYERALSSTVSPLRDAWRMGVGLLRLRGRLSRSSVNRPVRRR
jgi:dolichyl-phosphate beta-glucosyltransferase